MTNTTTKLCVGDRDNHVSPLHSGSMYGPNDAISSTAHCHHHRKQCKCLIPCRHRFDYQTKQSMSVVLTISMPNNRSRCWLVDNHHLFKREFVINYEIIQSNLHTAPEPKVQICQAIRRCVNKNSKPTFSSTLV